MRKRRREDVRGSEEKEIVLACPVIDKAKAAFVESCDGRPDAVLYKSFEENLENGQDFSETS